MTKTFFYEITLVGWHIINCMVGTDDKRSERGLTKLG